MSASIQSKYSETLSAGTSMYLSDIHQDEIPEVKSFIGNYEKSKIIADIKLGIGDKRPRELYEFGYIAVKFTDDVSFVDIVKFVVNCQADEFMGVFNGYYILFYD